MSRQEICQSGRDNVSVLISGNSPDRGQWSLEKSVITIYIQTLSNSKGDTINIHFVIQISLECRFMNSTTTSDL